MPGEELEALWPAKEPRRPVAAVLFGKSPAVVCDDGTVWLWTVAPHTMQALDESQRMRVGFDETEFRNLPHEWVQFHQPIPGSPAWSEYAR